MHRILILASLFALAASSSVSAASLSTADILYKFDYAQSGNVGAAGEITDSNGGNNNATTLFNSGGGKLTWTTVPITGPGGLPAVDPIARGLQFTPSVTLGDPDVVTNGGFDAANSSVSGDATLITRFYWDGYISDDSGAQMFWLVNNGLGGGGVGWMFGVRDTGTDHRLSIHRSGGGYSSFDAGSLLLTPGKWYEVAAVFHDDPGGNTFDFIKLYLLPEGGTLLTQTANIPVNSAASGTNLRVGSESLGGPASGNTLKAFQGTLDYLALWDTELLDHQIVGLLQVPEPSTTVMLLSLAGIGLLGYLRRRR